MRRLLSLDWKTFWWLTGYCTSPSHPEASTTFCSGDVMSKLCPGATHFVLLVALSSAIISFIPRISQALENPNVTTALLYHPTESTPGCPTQLAPYPAPQTSCHQDDVPRNRLKSCTLSLSSPQDWIHSANSAKDQETKRRRRQEAAETGTNV